MNWKLSHAPESRPGEIIHDSSILVHDWSPGAPWFLRMSIRPDNHVELHAKAVKEWQVMLDAARGTVDALPEVATAREKLKRYLALASQRDKLIADADRADAERQRLLNDTDSDLATLAGKLGELTLTASAARTQAIALDDAFLATGPEVKRLLIEARRVAEVAIYKTLTEFRVKWTSQLQAVQATNNIIGLLAELAVASWLVARAEHGNKRELVDLLTGDLGTTLPAAMPRPEPVPA